MIEVRLIDANALEKIAIPCETHNGALTELCVPLYQIRNAPTLNDKAYAIGYAAGSREGYKKGFEDARMEAENDSSK